MIRLETSRLYLREMIPSDAPLLVELNSDPEVVRYTGDTAFPNLKAAEDLIASYNQYRVYRTGRLLVFLKETNEFLGFCGLKTHLDESVDLGFRFHRKHWKQGFAHEASLECLNYGFKELNLDQIFGHFMKENFDSQKLLLRLGFKPFGIKKEDGHELQVYRLDRILY